MSESRRHDEGLGRTIEHRWEPIADPASLGASYLPACPARLVGDDGDEAAMARLALLWGERAAALRFRHAVLAMDRRTSPVELAFLQRQVFAWQVGATRLQGIRPTRILWLVGHLRARAKDPVIGAVYATACAELTVLLLAQRPLPASHDVADPRPTSAREGRIA
jgi:hypothetical protein